MYDAGGGDAGFGVRRGVLGCDAARHVATKTEGPVGAICSYLGWALGVGGQNRLVRHVGTGVRAIPILGAAGTLPSRRGVGD